MINKNIVKLIKPFVAIGIISYAVYFVISKLDLDIDLWDMWDIEEEDSF
jgi:hypothetical protein